MHFHSNGKLLISGEYLVLKGATAFAVPARFGQSLKRSETKDDFLVWESFFQDKLWFKGSFQLPNLEILESSNTEIAQRLLQYLIEAKKLNSNFLNSNIGLKITSNADFDVNWGLGSSSSLISNIAFWADIDPFLLHEKVSKGSGYDIACARSESALLFTATKGQHSIDQIIFDPTFKDYIYFVYLGQKQDSAKSVDAFLEGRKKYLPEIELISDLSKHIAKAQNINDFEYYLREHENIMSSVLRTPRIKIEMFNDFDGEIKSLGAWGGDFALLTWQGTQPELQKYFRRKKLNTIFSFDEIIK